MGLWISYTRYAWSTGTWWINRRKDLREGRRANEKRKIQKRALGVSRPSEGVAGALIPWAIVDVKALLTPLHSSNVEEVEAFLASELGGKSSGHSDQDSSGDEGSIAGSRRNSSV